MAQLLKGFGWIFIVAAAAVMAYPLFTRSVGNPLINALPAGLLLAFGAQLLTQGKNLSDADEKRSLFFLESCVKAHEEARNLLQDGNNVRIKWIAAGRALAHAKKLSANVTMEAHRRVLELHRLKYRGFFHSALADKTAAFFYGAADLSVPTDEAAALSTAGTERLGRTVTSTLNELSEKSLRAVWEAAQWPADYEDPLDRGFSDEEEAKLTVLFPGLHEYLTHKKRWHSASGKLFSRASSNERPER